MRIAISCNKSAILNTSASYVLVKLIVTSLGSFSKEIDIFINRGLIIPLATLLSTTPSSLLLQLSLSCIVQSLD